jgi:hypothetical protein
MVTIGLWLFWCFEANLITVVVNKSQMHLRTIGGEIEINLTDFGYNSEKPIEEGKNHLFDKDLIKSVQSFTRRHISTLKRMITKDHVVIGLASLDSLTLRHYADWVAVIGKNAPRITVVSGVDFDSTSIAKIHSRLLDKQYHKLELTQNL